MTSTKLHWTAIKKIPVAFGSLHNKQRDGGGTNNLPLWLHSYQFGFWGNRWLRNKPDLVHSNSDCQVNSHLSNVKSRSKGKTPEKLIQERPRCSSKQPFMDKKLLLSDGHWTLSKKKKKKNEVFSPTRGDQLAVTNQHLKMDVYLYCVLVCAWVCRNHHASHEGQSPNSVLSLWDPSISGHQAQQWELLLT